MNLNVKFAVIGAIGLLLGFGGGAALSQSLFPGYFENLGNARANDFENAFGVLAGRNGVPKTAEQLKGDSRNVLALQTLLVGQQFSDIGNETLRAEVKRLALIIEKQPELQPSGSDQTSKWASDARKCIIEQPNDQAVAACVKDSKYALRTSPASKPGRTASL